MARRNRTRGPVAGVVLRGQRHAAGRLDLPGPETAGVFFLAVKRAARPYKTATQNRFATQNTEGASTPRRARTAAGSSSGCAAPAAIDESIPTSPCAREKTSPRGYSDAQNRWTEAGAAVQGVGIKPRLTRMEGLHSQSAYWYVATLEHPVRIAFGGSGGSRGNWHDTATGTSPRSSLGSFYLPTHGNQLPR
jgi:hypothetical protein